MRRERRDEQRLRIPGELVVSGCYAPEVLKPAEAALDDISAFISTFVEVMDDDPVGLLGITGLAPRLTISARRLSPS
jgi:hypothetical protein